jgi:hypothetical protein
MARVKNIIESINKNFFLKKQTPLPSTIQLLKDLYPTVNWNRVDFYEGLPWFTPFIAPYVTAQALPQFYSFNRFSIYLIKFDETRAQCLADIVHEGMHVLQGMRFWKGYGLGMLRGFTIFYSALFVKYGYRNNPLEIPAYDQEFRFLDFCEKHHQHGIVPKVDMSQFKGIYKESSLVIKEFKFRYKDNFFLLLIGIFFSTMVAILKPVIDGLLFFIRMFSFKKEKQIN